MTAWTAIILAAGKGTRMNSKRPKVLHELCGVSMVSHVIAAATEAGIGRIVVIVGEGAAEVKAVLGPGYTYVEQHEQLGTGHAVLQARATINPPSQDGTGPGDAILVLNGDVPLVLGSTLLRLMARHEQRHAAMTFLTAELPEEGLGRIVRDKAGRVTGIVEWAKASAAQRRLTEINAGAYCFDGNSLWPELSKIAPSKSGEVYLTDMVEHTLAVDQLVETVAVDDPAEAIGVDTRVRLAEAEGVMRRRIRERLMLAGVTLIDPASTQIDAAVRIGRDTVIQPQTIIRGATTIGEDCSIGPWTMVTDSTIGNQCSVLGSVLEGATLENHVDIGPFSHLRPEAYLEEGVHIGNYVEIKKSHLARDVKSGHFSYIGDATIGRNVNIGAGSITCNFDGVDKLPTIIEDDAFVGCDTMLVAPVRMGARSKTGAGAVVTKDIPPDTLVAGVPARPMPSPAPAA